MGLIFFCYQAIYELRDIIFSDRMKPLRPIDNIDDIIYSIVFLSLFIRLIGNIFFFYLFFIPQNMKKK